jgi:gliding motility-associated-like protein
LPKIKRPSVELSLFILRLLSKTFLYTTSRSFIFLFYAIIMVADMDAQVTSIWADAVDSASYPVYTGKDPVFTFYSPPGIDVQGNLLAGSPFPGNFNFDWYKYNPASGNFDQLLLSHTGVTESPLTNLTAGGYQVNIRNGTDTDTTFTAWIHIDKIRASIIKDWQDKLLKSAYTCDYLTLSGAVSIDTFYYYDPINHAPVRLKNGYTFLWTSDNPDLRIPNKDKILDPNTTYLPPYLDTWYILTAVDSFGMKDIDSVLYESIQVKPLFSFKAFDKKEAKDIDAVAPYEDDSPLKIKFKNESVNGFSYEWIFSDSARSDLFASEITSDLAYQPEYTYKIPNDYYPAIVVTSEAGCIDSFRLDQAITVKPSLLEVPNVFSPDGNGLNDKFTVKFQSLKEFNIRIFDRAGKMVYKAEVTDMYTWEGWDGNVLDSDRQASPGAYFYVIEATGWDKKDYHKGQYRGVVYLFRQTQ